MAAIGISVDVPDMAAAAEFFSKGLGFEPLRQESPQTMVLDAGGIELWLLCKPEASPAVRGTNIRRTYARHWTPVHLDVLVDDLPRALARAVAAGARQEGGVVHDGTVSFVCCADPFGNGFCLIDAGSGHGPLPAAQ